MLPRVTFDIPWCRAHPRNVAPFHFLHFVPTSTTTLSSLHDKAMSGDAAFFYEPSEASPIAFIHCEWCKNATKEIYILNRLHSFFSIFTFNIKHKEAAPLYMGSCWYFWFKLAELFTKQLFFSSLEENTLRLPQAFSNLTLSAPTRRHTQTHTCTRTHTHRHTNWFSST